MAFLQQFSRAAPLRVHLNQLARIPPVRFIHQPPLDVQFAKAPQPTFLKSGAASTPMQTRLSNGVTVISQDSPDKMCCLGVSAADLHGVSRVFLKTAFGDNVLQDATTTKAILERIGCNVQTASTRDQLLYSMELLKGRIEEGVQQMFLTTCQPRFTPSSVEAACDACRFEYDYQLQTLPEALCYEQLNAAAYGRDSAIGHHSYLSAVKYKEVTVEAVQKFYDLCFSPSNLVVSCMGLDHDTVLRLMKPFESLRPSGKTVSLESVSCQYVGGECRTEEEVLSKVTGEETTHILVGFESNGYKGPEYVQLSLLDTLLGGGASFSSGGPGKGLYSRLYQQALCQFEWVQYIHSFIQFYDTTGVFGIQGITSPDSAGYMTQLLCQHWLSLIDNPVTSEELSRAKFQLMSNILLNLESRQVTCEDLGRQALIFGFREPIDELLKKIEAVTPRQLHETVQQMAKSKVTFASFGNVSRVPSYQAVANFFGK